MSLDPKFLRQHYAALSDQALLEIKRDDLVDVARQCYDEELRQRRFPPAVTLSPSAIAFASPPPVAPQEPDWQTEAVEVYGVTAKAGTSEGPYVAEARQALEAAGIPCRLQVQDEPEHVRPPARQWRLLVPGTFNQRAASILDRDIFNSEFEAEWKTLLETFPDEKVLEMNPRDVFCGLVDRLERVTRVYKAEMARRGLRIQP